MNRFFPRLRFLAFLLLLSLVPLSAVDAHAELESSQPPANATLDSAPQEIRLWFTEPVEPLYSRFTLIDQTGAAVETPKSEVAPGSSSELVMRPGPLADGVYTVAWRTLSAGDGHSAAGSFSFGIGAAVSVGSAADGIDESVPPESAAVRWLNLIGLSLFIGSIGFLLLACAPPLAFAGEPRALRRLTAVGWGVAGLGALLLLLLQAATAGGTPLLGSFGLVGDLLVGTNFGLLWLARMALWLAAGLSLLLAGRSRGGLWTALIFGAGMLLTQSLFTHAGAAQDAPAAVVGDWLHLLSATLWIGGLVAFLVALVAGRDVWAVSAEACGRLVAAFSNYARVAVIALIVTGLYAAWLDVGSVDALLSTVYGRALLVKLLLFLPLLALAATNLLVTSRRLESGDAVWVGRLRGLVGVEFALSAAILVMVAVMTSGSPARTVVAGRSAAQGSSAQPISQMKSVDDLSVHLTITPGTVGANTFTVMLSDAAGKAIDNASLIRMRFDHQQQDLGQSELRPVSRGGGTYAADGANLSVPGDWRIRLTIQRPDQFDSVVDFTPSVTAPSASPSAAPLTALLPDSARIASTLIVGVALLILGGGFALRRRSSEWTGARILGAALLAGGFVFAATGIWLAKGGGSVEVDNAWARPADPGQTAAIYLTIHNGTGRSVQVTSVQTDAAASATLHQTSITDQVARMRGLDVLDVAPDSTLELKPAGDHIMLEGLTRPLKIGDTLSLMVMLSTGDELMVPVIVQSDLPSDSAPPTLTVAPYDSGGY